MIETTNVQLHKKGFGVMVVVGVNSMPLKVIGKKTCSQTKNPFGLSKESKPKRCPNI
jgi:hypothetical protein